MFYELIRRHYKFIINTWYQFVGLCVATCFDGIFRPSGITIM